MCETSLSVWFVCRLCRGSFGQVDAFIEHKKQKHFTQFQNTTSIVFEEREEGLLHPAVTSNEDHQLAEELINERKIKIEVNDDHPINSLSSEIVDEPNLSLIEPKSERITCETKIIPDNENYFFSLQQPVQNPYVLLKRLTSEEIQRACDRKHDATLETFKQKNLAHSFQPPNSLNAHSSINDRNSEVEKSTEIGSVGLPAPAVAAGLGVPERSVAGPSRRRNHSLPLYKQRGLVRGLVRCTHCSVTIPLTLEGLLPHWRCGVRRPTKKTPFVRCPLCLGKVSGVRRWLGGQDKGFASHVWQIHSKEAFTPVDVPWLVFEWLNR